MHWKEFSWCLPNPRRIRPHRPAPENQTSVPRPWGWRRSAGVSSRSCRRPRRSLGTSALWTLRCPCGLIRRPWKNKLNFNFLAQMELSLCVAGLVHSRLSLKGQRGEQVVTRELSKTPSHRSAHHNGRPWWGPAKNPIDRYRGLNLTHKVRCYGKFSLTMMWGTASRNLRTFWLLLCSTRSWLPWPSQTTLWRWPRFLWWIHILMLDFLMTRPEAMASFIAWREVKCC